MARSTRWKSAEAEVAEVFGAYRVALSGGNSGGTRSDTDHYRLFIETKADDDLVLVTTRHLRAVRKRIKKGNRIPQVVFYRPGDTREDELLVVPLTAFYLLFEGYNPHVEFVCAPKRSAVYTLMENTKKLALLEDKLPVVAFKKGSFSGGILVTPRSVGLKTLYYWYTQRFKVRELLNRDRVPSLRRELT